MGKCQVCIVRVTGSLAHGQTVNRVLTPGKSQMTKSFEAIGQSCWLRDLMGV